MAWSFVAAGAVAGFSGTANTTVTLPTGYAAGDILVIAGTNGGGLSSSSTPSGWTARNAPTGACFFFKRAGTSESSAILDNGRGATAAVMLCYRGIFNADTQATATAFAFGGSRATGTQTTNFPDDLVVSAYFFDPVSGGTITAPGSTNTRVNSAATSLVSGLLVVDENAATAGSTTARTASIASSTQCGAAAASFQQGNPSGFFNLMR